MCRQSIFLSVNASIDFAQILIQVAQVDIFNSEDDYDCVKFKHKINDCSKMNQLMNNNLIHFNEWKRIYFNRAEQEETKIHL